MVLKVVSVALEEIRFPTQSFETAVKKTQRRMSLEGVFEKVSTLKEVLMCSLTGFSGSVLMFKGFEFS